MLVWFVLTGLSVAFIGVDIRRHARAPGPSFSVGWRERWSPRSTIGVRAKFEIVTHADGIAARAVGTKLGIAEIGGASNRSLKTKACGECAKRTSLSC